MNKQKLIKYLDNIVINLSFIAIFNALKNGDKEITDSVLDTADDLRIIIKELKKEQKENDQTTSTK